jgi:uncharacterized phage protein gp47/JayE
MVTIPTIAELKAQILADIEASDTTSALLPVAVWDVLATALAGAQKLLYILAQWLYKQIFTLTMDEDALTARGAEFGLVQGVATIWKGTATATGVDGTIIAAGKLCTIDSLPYEVDTAVEITGGSVSVTLLSIGTGDTQNRNNGDELSWSTPQTGLDSVCTVASTTQEAQDAETKASFRSEILARQRNKPQGGAIPDFNQWAKEVSGIGESFTFRPAPGYVNVYPLTDEDDPADRIPSTALLTQVQDYINDESRHPFGRVTTAIAFTELNFDIDFSNLMPNTAAVRTAIETAVEAYIYERRPQQFEDDTDPINKISAGEITAEAIAAGATNITTVLKNAGGSDISASGYTLEDNELSVPRTISWL